MEYLALTKLGHNGLIAAPAEGLSYLPGLLLIEYLALSKSGLNGSILAPAVGLCDLPALRLPEDDFCCEVDVDRICMKKDDVAG